MAFTHEGLNNFFWNKHIETLRPFEKFLRNIIDKLLFQKSDEC